MKVNYSKFPFFQVNSLQFLKEHTKFNMLHLIITHFFPIICLSCVLSPLYSLMEQNRDHCLGQSYVAKTRCGLEAPGLPANASIV